MNSILLKRWLSDIKDTANEVIPDKCQRDMFIGDLIIDIWLLCGADLDKISIYDDDPSFIDNLNIEFINTQNSEKIIDKFFEAYLHLGEDKVIWSDKYSKDMDDLKEYRDKTKSHGCRDRTNMFTRRDRVYQIMKKLTPLVTQSFNANVRKNLIKEYPEYEDTSQTTINSDIKRMEYKEEYVFYKKMKNRRKIAYECWKKVIQNNPTSKEESFNKIYEMLQQELCKKNLERDPHYCTPRQLLEFDIKKFEYNMKEPYI